MLRRTLDFCLYVSRKFSSLLIIAFYADSLLISSNSNTVLRERKSILERRSMNLLRKCQAMPDMDILSELSKTSLFLMQKSYALRASKMFMKEPREHSTTMPLKIDKFDRLESVDAFSRQAIRLLIYFSMRSGQDSVYAIMILAKFVENIAQITGREYSASYAILKKYQLIYVFF